MRRERGLRVLVLAVALAGSCAAHAQDDTAAALRAENARLRAQLDALRQACPAAAVTTPAPAPLAAAPAPPAAPPVAAAPVAPVPAVPAPAAVTATPMPQPAPTTATPPPVAPPSADASVPKGYHLAPDVVPDAKARYKSAGCDQGLFRGPAPAKWRDASLWKPMHPGMSTSEVESLLGVEHYDVDNHGALEWHYGQCGFTAEAVVRFNDGRVEAWHAPD